METAATGDSTSAARTMADFAAVTAALDLPLRRFARRLLRADTITDAVVNDVLQDTFIALYRQLPRLDAEAAIRPYAFGIARRRCLDELRRRLRRREVPYDEDPNSDDFGLTAAPPSPETEPEEVVTLTLLHGAVIAAIDRLPEAQRQALILFVEQGFSYEEIAAITEVSVGTVKSRIFYAKRWLRAALDASTVQAIHEMIAE